MLLLPPPGAAACCGEAAAAPPREPRDACYACCTGCTPHDDPAAVDAAMRPDSGDPTDRDGRPAPRGPDHCFGCSALCCAKVLFDRSTRPITHATGPRESAALAALPLIDHASVRGVFHPPRV